MTVTTLHDHLYELPDGTVVADLRPAGVYMDGTETATLAVAVAVVEPVGADIVKAQADLYSVPDDWVRMCNCIYKVMLSRAESKGISTNTFPFTRPELAAYGPVCSTADQALIRAEFEGNGYTVSFDPSGESVTITAP